MSINNEATRRHRRPCPCCRTTQALREEPLAPLGELFKSRAQRRASFGEPVDGTDGWAFEDLTLDQTGVSQLGETSR
jgi:hypothetical protein